MLWWEERNSQRQITKESDLTWWVQDVFQKREINPCAGIWRRSRIKKAKWERKREGVRAEVAKAPWREQRARERVQQDGAREADKGKRRVSQAVLEFWYLPWWQGIYGRFLTSEMISVFGQELSGCSMEKRLAGQEVSQGLVLGSEMCQAIGGILFISILMRSREKLYG